LVVICFLQINIILSAWPNGPKDLTKVATETALFLKHQSLSSGFVGSLDAKPPHPELGQSCQKIPVGSAVEKQKKAIFVALNVKSPKNVCDPRLFEIMPWISCSKVGMQWQLNHSLVGSAGVQLQMHPTANATKSI